jgi:hypothetical protein
MRAILAGLLAVFLAANGALGQDVQKKSVPIKADFSFFEDNWGLRVKAFALEQVQQKTPAGDTIVIGRITYVLEFEKDAISYDLDAIQNLFADKNRPMRHIFFDKDQIAIEPFFTHRYLIQGEISGVKGEAFRIIVDIVPDAETTLKLAKKLVVRPG